MELSFNVEPEAFPPTNIHIIIGRKGVGKTYLINNMINSLIDDETNTKKYGEFKMCLSNCPTVQLANYLFHATTTSATTFSPASAIPVIGRPSCGIR